MTKLPDGSYIPNLNGVKEPMVWSGADFTVIKGIHVNENGVEWWVHENGMYSTTVILEGTVNGVHVKQAALQIARPLSEKIKDQEDQPSNRRASSGCFPGP